VFDETNGSQVEQVDLDEIDDEEALCVALRNMSIGDVCPKESEEPTCRCFETQGVPGPTSELSPRAPAQMGRREAEREGGKGSSRREASVREWIPRPSC
jgi:hypothetical protein